MRPVQWLLPLYIFIIPYMVTLIYSDIWSLLLYITDMWKHTCYQTAVRQQRRRLELRREWIPSSMRSLRWASIRRSCIVTQATHIVLAMKYFILQYPVKRHHLSKHTLLVGVWHNDFWRHNQFLGEVTVSLDKVDWSNPSDKWYRLGESVSVCSSWVVYYRG